MRIAAALIRKVELNSNLSITIMESVWLSDPSHHSSLEVNELCMQVLIFRAVGNIEERRRPEILMPIIRVAVEKATPYVWFIDGRGG